MSKTSSVPIYIVARQFRCRASWLEVEPRLIPNHFVEDPRGFKVRNINPLFTAQVCRTMGKRVSSLDVHEHPVCAQPFVMNTQQHLPQGLSQDIPSHHAQ